MTNLLIITLRLEMHLVRFRRNSYENLSEKFEKILSKFYLYAVILFRKRRKQ